MHPLELFDRFRRWFGWVAPGRQPWERNPEQVAELAADPEFADAPRWFKEGLRSAGIPLPHHANRMVQNV